VTTKIDRKKFFTVVRDQLHAGHLTNDQVLGYTALLDAWEQKYDINPRSFLAYALATAFHETGTAIKPVREKGSDAYLSKYDTGSLAKALGNTPAADGDGQRYAGRGDVQLTGAANYRKAGLKLGIDLIQHPDLALDPHVAAQIMFSGMLEGWFTGKSFKSFLINGVFQKVNARRIINGTDCAVKIAGYYDIYVKAL
jgi:hypothetical protein